MPEVTIATSVLLALLVAVFSKIFTTLFWGKGPRYPPGPPANFLWGNAFQIPQKDLARVFEKWGKEYQSDILHASAFGKHIVVINSRSLAEELLDGRAAIYSDRPHFPVVKLLGWDFILVFMGYGSTWRQHRKICQQNFNKVASQRYWPMQLESTHEFLRNSLDKPDKIWEHIQMLAVSSALSMMYGYKPESLDDPVVRITDQLMAIGSTLLTAWVNHLPFLRYVPDWMPGSSTNKLAKYVKTETEKMKRIPMDHLEKQLKDGTARPSLMTDVLERKAAIGITEEEEEANQQVAWTIYGAASDTTVCVVEALVHILVQHPEVQKKAQADIDRVIGQDRLPDFRDRASLPYIDAIYRELMRHTPIARIAFTHALTEDDVYNQYFLPKGATVMANIWAMTHDETVYPDPFSFKPERFLDADGNLNDDSRILIFGFGRRECVGKHVANSSLWLVIVSILACFNLNKALNEDGSVIEIDDEYIDCVTLHHKKPFKFDMKCRSGNIAKLIQAATDGAATS